MRLRLVFDAIRTSSARLGSASAATSHDGIAAVDS
jgi:hypothetical protein